jgi:hypothetical protein
LRQRNRAPSGITYARLRERAVIICCLKRYVALSGKEHLKVTVCVPAVLPLFIQDYVQALQY